MQKLLNLRIFRLLNLIACIIIYSNCISQENAAWQLQQNLNSSSGLIQNSINGMYFDDASGFLWIATESELVKYNGTFVTKIDNQFLGNKNGKRIASINKSLDSSIVVIDRNKNLYKINGNNIEYKKEYKILASNGIRRYVNIPTFKNINKLNSIISEIQLQNLTLSICYINDSSIFYSNKKEFTLIEQDSSYSFNTKESDKESFRIIKQGKNIFVLDLFGNCYFLNIQLKKLEKINLTETKRYFNNGNCKIYYNEFDGRTFLINNTNIYEIIIKDKKFTFNYITNIEKNIPNVNSVSCIYESKNNRNLFIGTNNYGLFIFSKNIFTNYQFNNPKKFIGDSSQLNTNKKNNDLTYSMAQYSDDKILTCTGVFFNLKDSTFSLPISKTDLFLNNLQKVGNSYYSGYGIELNKFDYLNNNFKLVFKKKVKINTCYFDTITNNFWVYYPKVGLGILKNDEFQNVIPNAKENHISFIKRCRNKLLLHSQNDIYELDETKKELIKLYSFENTEIRDLYLDIDNFLWISTYGSGIYIYDFKSKKIYKPKTDQNKFLMFSHSFVEKNENEFFIPTNYGMFYLNRKNLLETCFDSTKQLLYYFYNTKNGLITNEFNGGFQAPLYLKLNNSDFLFPTMQGVARLHTNDIPEPTAYPIYIESVKTDFRKVVFKDSIEFTKNERNLIFTINMAQWEFPVENGLTYKLDDNNWVGNELETNSIILNDLKAGWHKLTIKKVFDINNKQVTIREFYFFVNLKSYEKIWFWFLLSLLSIGCFYFYSYFRNKKLYNSNKLLTNNVNQKTTELSKTILELENTIFELDQSQSFLIKVNRLNEMISAILAHDIRSPLRFLTLVSEQIHQKVINSSDKNLIDLSNKSRTSLRELYGFTETFLMWTNTKSGNIKVIKNKFKLQTVITEIVKYYQQLLEFKNNKITLLLDETISIFSNKEMVAIIIRNLIDNANKFTDNGEICIKVFETNKFNVLTISDTGKGIDLKLVEWLLNNDVLISSPKKIGLGLVVIKELSNLLNVKLSIIRNYNNIGTIVTLEFTKDSF